MMQLQDKAVYCLSSEFPSILEQWSKQDFGDAVDGIGSKEDSEMPMNTQLRRFFLRFTCVYVSFIMQ